MSNFSIKSLPNCPRGSFSRPKPIRKTFKIDGEYRTRGPLG